jgi:hypothetical protein
MINLASTFPDRVEEMNLMIEQHMAETGGVYPIANPDYIK